MTLLLQKQQKWLWFFIRLCLFKPKTLSQWYDTRCFFENVWSVAAIGKMFGSNSTCSCPCKRIFDSNILRRLVNLSVPIMFIQLWRTEYKNNCHGPAKTVGPVIFLLPEIRDRFTSLSKPQHKAIALDSPSMQRCTVYWVQSQTYSEVPSN